MIPNNPDFTPEGSQLGVLVGWAAAHEEDNHYWSNLGGVTRKLRRRFDL
jgi:hypothetical protein